MTDPIGVSADELTRLNDALNAATDDRLTAAYDAARAAHQAEPSDDTYAAMRQAENAQDEFWEARDAARREEIASLAAPEFYDPQEYEALGSVVEERDTAVAEAVGVLGTDHTLADVTQEFSSWDTTQAERDFEAQLDEPFLPGPARQQVVGPARTNEAYAALSDAQSGLAPDTASANAYARLTDAQTVGITGAQVPVSFADQVDAWYQAVQPTGEIRRVRDEELFDRNGYSQQSDAVAVQAGPVSEEFAAAHRPTTAPSRWEARMQANPSLASAVTRDPSLGQGPPAPKPGPTMKP